MYRCSFCKKVVPPGTSCKRVLRTRMFRHPFRVKVQKRLGIDKNGKIKIEWADDPGGYGSQITAEYPVCEECEINAK